MAAQSTYLDDKMLDHTNGVASYAMPTVYVALIRVTAGQSPRSAAVALDATTAPAAPNGHIYRCTSAGTTGATEPTWPTVSGSIVTDGTVVWTEMTADFQANNANVLATEANYAGYARVPLAGLMGAAASGTAYNSAAITSTTCTGGSNTIAGFMTYDALTGGNLLKFGPQSTGSTLAVITTGNPTASIAIGAMTTSMA